MQLNLLNTMCSILLQAESYEQVVAALNQKNVLLQLPDGQL